MYQSQNYSYICQEVGVLVFLFTGLCKKKKHMHRLVRCHYQKWGIVHLWRSRNFYSALLEACCPILIFITHCWMSVSLNDNMKKRYGLIFDTDNLSRPVNFSQEWGLKAGTSCPLLSLIFFKSSFVFFSQDFCSLNPTLTMLLLYPLQWRPVKNALWTTWSCWLCIMRCNRATKPQLYHWIPCSSVHLLNTLILRPQPVILLPSSAAKHTWSDCAFVPQHL